MFSQHLSRPQNLRSPLTLLLVVIVFESLFWTCSGFAEFALLSKIFGYKLFHVVRRLAVLGPLCVHASRLIQVISRELRLSVCGVSESKPSRDHVASARVKVVQPSLASDTFRGLYERLIHLFHDR